MSSRDGRVGGRGCGVGDQFGFAQAGAGSDEAAYDELMLGSNTAMEDFL